jgi:regulator of protease activity HflC (stomatin/prohibitin superfamily)
MSLFMKDKPLNHLVHYRRPPDRVSDFSVGADGLTLLAVVMVMAFAARLLSGSAPSTIGYGVLLGAPITAIALVSLIPRWSAALMLLLGALFAAAVWGREELGPGDSALALAFLAAGALAAPSVQKMEEWERAIVMRFGRFRRVRGPGLFLLLPVADRVAKVVDLRTRVTDFTAETTLTRDSVTITVDALCFWLVWDAEKAVSEVAEYEDAVILSAKTALRSAISENSLTAFLERGEEIEGRISETVDKKTTEWGITVQHIEITDVQVPAALQESLSRLAQAEREKQGRILLAEAEIEIARRLEQAAAIYGANEVAMKLRSLSILNEGLKAGNSMMLVPNSITEELRTKDLFGLEALTEARRHANRRDPAGGEKSKEDADDRR